VLLEKHDILLVEDDVDHGDVVFRWLTKKVDRLNIQWARTGAEAIALMSRKHFKLLLLDYYLPDMTAFTLLDRAYPQGNCDPFILITAAGGDELKRKAIKRGALNVIVKSNRSLQRLSRALGDALRQETRPANETPQLYFELLENANDAIYFHDPQGLFIYLNRKAEALTGYSREELLHKPISTILLDDGRKILRQKLRSNRVLRWDRKFELEIKTKQNRVVPVELTVSPILRNKKLVGFEGVARDIRERKRHQRKVDEQEARIHQLNLELQKTNMKLEERSRIQSEFVSNISHEFRTPINGIIGYTDLLLDEVYGKMSDEQNAALQHIRGCATSLLNMVQEILDLSKIKSNQLALDKEFFSPDDLIEATIGTIRPVATRKGLVVEKQVKQVLPPVYADFRRLYQVFVNLVDNAVKFTSRGKISVGATLLPQSVRFFVKDTGIGVNAEVRELIFQEFRQGDNSNTRYYGGIGLGLSLSKRLIELHDGKIGLESESRNGSTFYFSIPLDEDGTRNTQVSQS